VSGVRLCGDRGKFGAASAESGDTFATDNNGVIVNNGAIVELPAVSTPETRVSGWLIFGIGTQSNNGLNGATVDPVDANGNFITTYKGQYNNSFIDSASNAIFFLLNR
jgi:hypothetical protein